MYCSIYIIRITVKLFSDDTSLLSAVYKTNISATQLESNLKNISHLTYKWKITFKSDLCQQAQIICARANVSSIPSISCNTVPVLLLYCYQRKYQKQLGLYLEDKLSVYDHFNSKLSKANKANGILKRFLNIYPKSSLLTIYNSFIRQYRDFCDIIYHYHNNERFCTKIERIHYNAAVAINGAMKETSYTKLYEELVLESSRFRNLFRLLSTFFKIKTSGEPEYHFNVIQIVGILAISKSF